MAKWASPKSIQLSTSLHQTSPWLENAQNLILKPSAKFKIWPFLRLHPQSNPIINTHTKQVKNYIIMDSSWDPLKCRLLHGQNSLLCSKTRIWLPTVFKKNSTHQIWAQFLKGNLLLQNWVCHIIHTHLWVRESWLQLLINPRPEIMSTGFSYYENGLGLMPKGQLSREPWLGNIWMLYTFQAAIWTLQQPQRHSYSL